MLRTVRFPKDLDLPGFFFLLLSKDSIPGGLHKNPYPIAFLRLTNLRPLVIGIAVRCFQDLYYFFYLFNLGQTSDLTNPYLLLYHVTTSLIIITIITATIRSTITVTAVVMYLCFVAHAL